MKDNIVGDGNYKKLTTDFKSVPNIVADLKEFNEKFKNQENHMPGTLDADRMKLRLKLVQEEVDEFKLAALELESHLQVSGLSKNAVQTLLADMLDACVDIVYVAANTAIVCGFDFNEAWRRVHEKNMLKVCATSADQSKRGSIHDIIKPEGWTPPDHTDLIEPNLYTEHYEKP